MRPLSRAEERLIEQLRDHHYPGQGEFEWEATDEPGEGPGKGSRGERPPPAAHDDASTGGQ
jgi:hypothetical protein